MCKVKSMRRPRRALCLQLSSQVASSGLRSWSTISLLLHGETRFLANRICVLGNPRFLGHIRSLVTKQTSTPSKESGPERSCEDIRRLLRYLVASRQYTMKELRSPEMLNLDYRTYYRFMYPHRPGVGKKSKTFAAALPFFADRYERGINDEEEEVQFLEKKKVTDELARVKREKRVPRGMFILSPRHKRLEDIKLDGEEDESVPIFDDSLETYRKLLKYLDQNKNNYDKLKSELEAQFKKRKVEFSLEDLRAPTWSKTSKKPMYYAAYVLFEKYRLAQGRPKSDHRMKNQWKWPEGGYQAETQEWRRIETYGRRNTGSLHGQGQ